MSALHRCTTACPRSRFRGATRTACLLLLVSAVGANPPAAHAQAEVPTAPYPFLSSRDPVARAMAEVWRAQFEAPASREEASRLYARRAAAEQTVREESARAAALLLETLDLLAPGDLGGHVSLLPLLRLVGPDPGIVTHLAQRLEDPPARTGAAAGGAGVRESRLQPELAVRGLLLDRLVAGAREGDRLSRRRLLDLLASPDAATRAAAVAGFYRASRDRLAAQRAMRPRLAPEDQFLLYRD